MKHYEDVPVPATTRRQCVKRTCDLCGKEGNKWGCWKDAAGFGEPESTVELRTGHQYPEGGTGTKWEIDICPECFENKLVPWVRSRGADIQLEEWNTY